MDILNYKNSLNKIAELGWQENKTTDYIASHLKIKPIKRGFGKGNTGLLYKIGSGSQSILLRADIDGLKTSGGVRHSCGHSTHMASLMGAVQDSIKWEGQLSKKNRSIYFLFQPAEETFPSGAQTFVKECADIIGTIRSAYAIHVRPLMELGTVGLQSGVIWARGDYMEIDVQGKMVHIKNNLTGVDAIYASALIVEGIKKIQNKYDSIRIGIGVITGGRQANTVADQALLKGDIRLSHPRWQARIKKMLHTLIEKVMDKTGAKITLRYFDGTPPVINNKKTTVQLVKYLQTRTDCGLSLKTDGLFSYGCEDFAYIAEKVPSTIALIGTGDSHDLHEEACTISDQGTINAYSYFKAVVDWFIQS